MSKKQEKQYSISISTEDFTYDTKNNIVQMVDSEGKTVAVDTWKYAIYFFENIQRKDISEHSVYLDGLRLDKFVEIFIKQWFGKNRGSNWKLSGWNNIIDINESPKRSL